MKIVIAPDSFKGNMTSLQVAKSIENGIRRVLPGAKCIKIPMADGGEGTVQSLVDATGGKFVFKKVTGPAGQPVRARYGMLEANKIAVIEMAEASGLSLVEGASMNPLKTTTYGTGELIIDAIDKGAKQIIIGIGGSATNDGGAGMAQAIGVKFFSRAGRQIKEYGAGGMLKKIAAIDMSALHPRVRKTKIIIASDVDNPLYGKRGAACVYGPQKGATTAMIKQLDDNLRHFSGVIKKQLRKNVQSLKGAGAAGGLGAGLVAFANADIQSGIDIIARATELKKHIKGADLVITGEGRVDFQTAFGKTPAGVARLAKKQGIPVIVIGGGLADDAAGVFKYGIDGLASAAARDMTLAEAIKLSRRHLANAAERAIRMILIGKKMAAKNKSKK